MSEPIIGLERGRVYTVAGRGEMMLAGVDGDAILMTQHGGRTYHASQSQIVQEATRRDLHMRHLQAAPRGVDCTDPECWCRFYGLGMPTVHLNGTSRDDLVGMRTNALGKLREAMDAIRDMAPNARDYYVLKDYPRTFNVALEAHNERLGELRRLYADIELEAEAIADGLF